MSGLEFCEAVHPTLSEGSARRKLGYVDDFNLAGKKEDMTFLGSPVLPSRPMNRVLQGKIDDLGRAIQRLALLQAQDALCLLKNSIAMPKLFVRYKEVTVLQQSIIGHLRRHTQTRVVVGTERRTERQPMGTSESTSPYGWSWNEERGHAGIFTLFGLGCSLAPTPRRHPL